MFSEELISWANAISLSLLSVLNSLLLSILNRQLIILVSFTFSLFTLLLVFSNF